MSSSTNLHESAEQGGGNIRSPRNPRAAARRPAQDDNSSRPNDQQTDQPSRRNIQDKNGASRGGTSYEDTRTQPPALPPAPSNFFSREKIVNKILDRTDRVKSVALYGPIGVGKSSVALALLHNSRTKARFGPNRHFMRCDDITKGGFFERLSHTLNTDPRELYARLRSSPPLMLLLDGLDSIFDSPTPEARSIAAKIQTFGNYENVCLVTTSRMNPEIRGFYPVEIPILPEDGARDTFYRLCNLPRSPTVDSLIARMDFHPLSIELLASFVRKNDWDEPKLLNACGDDQAHKLKTSYYGRLREAIQPALRSPTIKRLGTRARDVLKEIAAWPDGIKEYELERKMAGTGEVVDVLGRFSLVYRQDGLVKMLFPFRSYLVGLTLVPPKTEEIIYRDHPPAKYRASFPF